MYESFNGSTVLTNSGAAWTIDEFIGDYLFFVGRVPPVSQAFTTDYATSTSEILVSSALTYFSVNDQVLISTTGTLPTGLSQFQYYVKTVTADHLTLSTAIGGATVTFSTNGTGSHSIILMPNVSGVTTYGKITDNNATTITATLVGASTAPTTYGYFIIHRGYLIDFAHDISSPSALTNLDVNKTCFEYSDNDDKRKLSTKIVATGKDLQGKTISVAVAGVHAYDNDTQFYKDSTFITKNSEGYVLKNSYLPSPVSCTAIPGRTVAYTKTDVYTVTDTLTLASATGIYVNQKVSFTNPPRPLVAGIPYWITSLSTATIKVSATQGGSNITILENTNTEQMECTFTTTDADGYVTVTIKGTVAASLYFKRPTTGAEIAAGIAPVVSGFVDSEGVVWTGTYAGTNAVYISGADTGHGGTSAPSVVVTTTTDTTLGQSSVITAKTGCNAVIPSQIQLDNSAGLFVKGTPIVFSAATMPTGLTAYVIYTCGDDGVSSSTFMFTVMSGGTVVAFSSAGTTVIVYNNNKVINPDTSANAAVWLNGWGYVIPSGTVCALVIPGGAATEVTTSGTPTTVVLSDGSKATKVVLTSMIYGELNFSGRGYLLSPRLYVADHTKIGGDYAVLIGEEAITITARGNNATYGNYIDVGAAKDRVTSATIKCYPHGVGALVARTNYTEASPEPGAPIAPPDPAYPTQHGLYIDYRTVDSNITYGQLDAYATSLLLGLGNFYGKATTWSPLEYAVVKEVGEFYGSAQTSRSRPIMIGDSITITNFDGDTPSDPYEVVETTIICNEGRMKMQLGDFEKNAYTTLMSNTNSINNTLT